MLILKWVNLRVSSMNVDRRAYFNLLRQNWLMGWKVDAEHWEVENYRVLPIGELFESLKDREIYLDTQSFQTLAEEYDSPEELTDSFEIEGEEGDRIYLIVFELWRRLVPDKQTFSIFCDEIDQQIFLADNDRESSLEKLEDVLANLLVVLNEMVDAGYNHQEAFEAIEAGCASDITSFLYDFIATQIDVNNSPYATELLEGFLPFIEGDPWFDLLRVRLIAESDTEVAAQFLEKLIVDSEEDCDLEFTLEILTYLSQSEQEEFFYPLVERVLEWITIEAELQELMEICEEYFRFADEDQKERRIRELLDARAQFDLDAPVIEADRVKREIRELLSAEVPND